jgi:hypothetical protein
MGVAAQAVVDHMDVVTALGEAHRRGPAEVPVTTEDHDPHRCSFRERP